MRRIMIAALTFSAMMFGAAQQLKAELLVAVNTTNQIFRFDSATPGAITVPVAVSGLLAGESIVGIDRRPVNGLIYAVSSASNIYTLNEMTGAASFVSTLSIPLSGTSFGVDFNPVVDRLRIVSNTDQNLRVNVATGAVAIDVSPTGDGPLAYAAGDSNFGTNPNIIGSAYSNNFAGTSTTTLRGIDSGLGVLVIQNPPNAGTLNTSLSLINPNSIDPRYVAYDVSGLTGVPYVTFTAPNGTFSSLYSIGPMGLSLIGQIGTGMTAGIVNGLAAPVGAAIPEPATMILLGTGLAGIAAKVRRRRKGNKSDAA